MPSAARCSWPSPTVAALRLPQVGGAAADVGLWALTRLRTSELPEAWCYGNSSGVRHGMCGSFSRHRPDGGYVVLQATSNPWGLTAGAVLELSDTLCARMVTGGPRVVGDLREAPVYATLPAVSGLGIAAYVGWPIVQPDGTVFGSLCGLNRSPAEVPDDVVRTVALGSELLGTILALEQQLVGAFSRAADAERQATLDPLTGLANRRAFDAAVAAVEQRAQAHGNRPGVIAVDLDDMKGVNDSLGHAGGDVLLGRVAGILRTSFPVTSTIARVGGDEFLVLLEDLPSAELAALAERLRDRFATQSIAASVGMASASDREALADVMVRADRDMFACKPSPRRERPTPIDPVRGWLRHTVPGGHSSQDTIRQLLDRSRAHLGLDVLFVGRWHDGVRTFAYVSAEEALRAQLEGTAQPLPDTYCQAIVEGRTPRAIPDAQVEPSGAHLALTHDFGIGAHVGVPLHFPDGRLYGTICGAGFKANPTINDRDATFLLFLADVIGTELAGIERGRRSSPSADEHHQRDAGQQRTPDRAAADR